MTEQEKVAIQEKTEAMRPFFSDSKIKSRLEFLVEKKRLENLIESGQRPDSLDNRTTLAAADKEIYEEALEALVLEYVKDFPREDYFDRSKYLLLDFRKNITKTKDLDRIVGNLIEDAKEDKDELSAIRIAARQYRREIEVARVEDDGWALGLWSSFDEFKKTDATKRDVFLTSKAKELIANGWKTLESNPDLLKNLFLTAFAVSELIEELNESINKVTPDQIEALQKKIEELEVVANPGDSGVAESNNVFKQIKSRFDNFKKRWRENINDSFRENVEKKGSMLKTEIDSYDDFYTSLVILDQKLTAFRVGFRSPEVRKKMSKRRKEVIDELWQDIEDGSEFLDDIRIPQEDRGRLISLYDRLEYEMEIINGTATAEKENIFSKRVREWMEYRHLDKYSDTKVFWDTYQAGNLMVLEDDVAEMREHMEYFQDQKNNLRQTDGDDFEYHKYKQALEIQINRLQEMIGKVEGGEGKSEEDSLPISSEDLLRPSSESQFGYESWLKERLKLAEDNPKIYENILHEIKEMILERLNNIKEISAKWGDFPLLEAYSGIAGYIDVDSSSPNVLILQEIKTKSSEIEKIRTITDVAHEYGVSRGMVSVWEGFSKHEGENGLSPLYYDYFAQEWGDGSEKEDGSENRYEHALLMNKTIHAYLEWLRFGEGKNWSDGAMWKGKAKDFCMDFAEKETASDGVTLSDYDKDEFYGLLYNMVYGLGIRQHSFIDQHAVGATPGGAVGAQWSQVADVQYFPTFQYAVYKEAEFSPIEGIFAAPAAWLQRCKDAGLIAQDRITNINNSSRFTKLVMKIFGPLREPTQIGLKKNGFDKGTELTTAYDTLFEVVFLRAKERKESRARGYDFTFPDFISGHKSYVDFRKRMMGVPGNLFGKFDKDTPEEKIKDKVTEAVRAKTPEELVTILVADYKEVVNKKFSYLKMHWFSVDPNQTSYAILAYIDKMFRVMSLSDEVTASHRYKLLSEIRKITMAGANMTGLCKRDEIYGVKSDEKIAWSSYEATDEHGDVTTIRRDPNKFDIRDFILNRIPNTIEDYEGSNFIANILKPISNVADSPITIVDKNMDNRIRIDPASFDNIAEHGTDRHKLWWKLRQTEMSDTFKRTTYYAFGVPDAAQKSEVAKE